MEFISAHKFKNLPKEVQKVFLDWWKGNTLNGDLLININDAEEIECVKEVVNNMIISFSDKSYEGLDYFDAIPLLAEGQLRRFIEDEINCKLNIGNVSRVINIYKKELDIPYETDLLQAYWKIALEISKEVKS